MGKPNWANRTMFTGDNLDIMRGMNSDSVDLIYLDPPLNSKKNYEAPVGSAAAGAAFKDTWTLSDVDLAWHGEIAEQHPGLYSLINTTGIVCNKAMQSYLIMMAVRLLEMKRVLRATGSIYLHCDTTASHYLKLAMDAVFSEKNFQNEVVWKRHRGRNDGNRFGRVHDTILFYTKGESYTWNDVFDALKPKYVKDNYKHYDERSKKFGPYRVGDLTGPGTSEGDSGQPWQGADPTISGRCWSVPLTGRYAPWIEDNIIPNYLSIESIHGRLDALEEHDLIVWPKKLGGMPQLKRYLSASRGTKINDVITNILRVDPNSEDATGYPTEKPEPLLEHIIKASSNEGDVILDPFCGCATACVVADRLNREWVGIDLSPVAAKLVRDRILKEGPLLYDLIPRDDVPHRTDVGELPPYRTHKHTLFGKQEGLCNGCGIAFPFRNFTIDHKTPQSKGGTDHIDNLQLLCNACNSKKGAGTQAELIVALRQEGIIN